MKAQKLSLLGRSKAPPVPSCSLGPQVCVRLPAWAVLSASHVQAPAKAYRLIDSVTLVSSVFTLPALSVT